MKINEKLFYFSVVLTIISSLGASQNLKGQVKILALNGTPGGDCRRQVCVEYLYFNPDGSIKPITLTTEGVSVKPKN